MTAPAAPPTDPPAAPPRPRSALPEVVFQGLTRAAGLSVLVLVGGLVLVLLVQAWPALSRAGEYRMFTSSDWVPKPADGSAPRFGVLAFIYGTVVTSVIAMLIAVPLGVASAAYLSEIARPRTRKVAAFLIELLAAIPSVVYGFWGLFFLAPVVQAAFNLVGGPNTGGNGVLSAGLILAIMVLPYITAISYDVCQAVPRSQREGSLALGATRWQTIRNVVLPYARPGIIAASFLALGRALGETMAVTMLIGNQAVIDPSPFALGDSIASRIANQLNEADAPEFRSALIALALVLMATTAAFNVLARALLTRLNRGPKVRPARPSGGPVTAASVTAARPADPTLVNGPPPAARPRNNAQVWDKVMTRVLAGSLLATVIPLFLILGYITVRGAGAVGPSLFTERSGPPLDDAQYGQYQKWQQGEAEYPRNQIGRPVRRGGLGNAMLGSLMIVGAATALAVPLGLLAAIYLAEARKSPTANVVRFVTEQLGGVPSIVIGIFAYVLLVNSTLQATAHIVGYGASALAGYVLVLLAAALIDPKAGASSPAARALGTLAAVLAAGAWYAASGAVDRAGAAAFGPSWTAQFGFNGWAGAFALAVMMIPIIVRSAEESMKLVPESIRQASYALGGSRMQTTLRVVLPASLPAVVTGIFLAVGRIAGETAPLLLTAGGSDFWPSSPSSQTPYLPGSIFSYSRSQFADWRDQAWGAAVVLLSVVMLLNVGIRLVAGKRVVAASRAD